MTSYLLDTHIFLWWVEDQPILTKRVRDILSRPEHDLFVSAITPWEIAIKHSVGKMKAAEILLTDFRDFTESQGFHVLDITSKHAQSVSQLPLLHRDPFDRMLVAQAMAEKLTLITRDPNILRYDIAKLAV